MSEYLTGAPGYRAEHIAAYSAEYLAGIDLFNAREFHAAHDVWEERWRDDSGPREKLFLQGLIQSAVVFHYLELGRVGAARSMFQRAGEKFDALGLTCVMSLDLAAFRCRMEECLSWLFTGPAAEIVIPDGFDAPFVSLESEVTPPLD